MPKNGAFELNQLYDLQNWYLIIKELIEKGYLI